MIACALNTLPLSATGSRKHGLGNLQPSQVSLWRSRANAGGRENPSSPQRRALGLLIRLLKIVYVCSTAAAILYLAGPFDMASFRPS
jgi:hypothetical protein